MSDNVVAALALVFIFGMPTIAFMVIRAMQHRERIEMIRHGFVPRGGVGRDWSGAAQAPPPRAAAIDDDDPQRTLRKGVVVSFIGLALTIGLSFIGFLVDPPNFRLGPWLLGGLIPMFIGIAQVVTALMFGATFPAMQAGRYGPGPGLGAEPSAAPPFEGPYTYRPDPTTQELQPPARPPDRR